MWQGGAVGSVGMRSQTTAQEAIVHSITVSTHLFATPAQVWSKIGDPGAIDAWHPDIASSQLRGADRLCTLTNGAQIDEHIDHVDEANRAYSYRIVKSPLPIDDYRSTIKVVDAEGGCLVEWSSNFRVAAGPAEDMVALVKGVYDSGMSALRESFSS